MYYIDKSFVINVLVSVRSSVEIDYLFTIRKTLRGMFSLFSLLTK